MMASVVAHYDAGSVPTPSKRMDVAMAVLTLLLFLLFLLPVNKLSHDVPKCTGRGFIFIA
jgi:hypothetical protein